MKKLLCALLALCLTLGLAACGKGTPDAAESVAPLTLLETVWAATPESERFAALGGDAEHLVDDAPGSYSVTDADSLANVFGVPADRAADVAEAASLLHMMNANTFTAGAFRLAEGVDRAAFVSALRESVLNRQWLCGFPDKLLILAVGDTVVSVFGAEELVAQFKARALDRYPAAETLAEDALAF